METNAPHAAGTVVVNLYDFGPPSLSCHNADRGVAAWVYLYDCSVFEHIDVVAGMSHHSDHADRCPHCLI